MSTSFLNPSIRPSSYLPPLFSGQMKQVFCLSLCVLTCVCCFRCSSGSEGRGGLPEAPGDHEGGRHRRAPRIARWRWGFIHVGGARIGRGYISQCNVEMFKCSHVAPNVHSTHPTVRCYPELAHTTLTMLGTKRLGPNVITTSVCWGGVHASLLWRKASQWKWLVVGLTKTHSFASCLFRSVVTLVAGIRKRVSGKHNLNQQ